MRLPSPSFALAVWVFLYFSPAPAFVAHAAASLPAAAGCMSLGEPEPMDVSAKHNPEDVLPAAARPFPVPTPLDGRGLAHRESYEDVFEILSRENGCSRFFGGPARAVEAFNQFARRLSNNRLGTPAVAVRMEGVYTRYQNNETGATYRIFDRAVINRDGPFGPPTPSGPRMRVGRYQAHTPQARALVLLHELGHLVADGRGEWLLPNDGHDSSLSARNTREVEARCAEQLEAIRR